MPVNAQEPGPVNVRRFDHLCRDGGIVVAEDQRGDWDAIDHVREDQSPEFAIKTYGLHGAYQRDEDTLVGSESVRKGRGNMVSRSLTLSTSVVESIRHLAQRIKSKE